MDIDHRPTAAQLKNDRACEVGDRTLHAELYMIDWVEIRGIRGLGVLCYFKHSFTI